MNNVMLDLETMSTDPKAAIVAIGAVAFDLDAEATGHTFYETISLASSAAAGGVIDADTVTWWLSQPAEARSALLEQPQPIGGVLGRFAAWLDTLNPDGNGAMHIWGNGCNFDNVIAAAAYRSIGVEPPWRWWWDRDYRTAKHLYRRHLMLLGAPVPEEPEPAILHHALHDAMAAATHLIDLHRSLRVRLARTWNLADHIERQAAFSAATFGPGQRVAGVVDHIRKELVEVEQSDGALAEWIDVVILALDGAWRSGATPFEIIEALVAKQTRNESRTWPDWRTAEPGKAIEHDRTAEQVGS